MYDPKEVFKALPHIQTIWVTKDGNFHLHSNNGGERIDREELNASLELIAPIKAVVTIENTPNETVNVKNVEQPIKLRQGRNTRKYRAQ
jgi:hypothetical protein